MKKYLALLLALCMVFTLCACGSRNDSYDDYQESYENEEEYNNGYEEEYEQSEEEYEQYEEEEEEPAPQSYPVEITADNLGDYFSGRNVPVYDVNGTLVRLYYKLIPNESIYDLIDFDADNYVEIYYDVEGISSYVEYYDGIPYFTRNNGSDVYHLDKHMTLNSESLKTLVDGYYYGGDPYAKVGIIGNAQMSTNGSGFNYSMMVKSASGTIYLYY